MTREKARFRGSGWDSVATDSNRQHIYVIPVGERLRRSLAIFSDESIAPMVNTAINATTGTRMSIDRHTHPALMDSNPSLVRESVASIHRAITETYPEIHEMSRGHQATKVHYDRRNLYIVMEPILYGRSRDGR